MRLEDLARAKGTTLADIFGYIDNAGSNSFAITPNEMSGGEQGWGTTGLGLEAADPQANNGADGNVAQAPVVFKPPEAFAQGVTLSPNSSNGEGSGGYHFNVDASKFPQTRFGDVTNAAPVNAYSSLYDPRFVYDDPNYGRISFAQNFKPDRLNTTAQMALMSAAMGGIGLLGAPALATQLVNLARALGNGGNGIGSLIGILGSQLGLPTWGTSLAQLAGNQLMNRGGRG